jgi:hypothetical protein
MVRLWGQRGSRRVQLGIGTLGSIEPRVPETAAGDSAPVPICADASPDAAYPATIRAGLVGGPLGREAGLATWVRLPVLYRLLRGLDEEQPSVERLISHYGVDISGLLEQLATGALRCQVEGHPAPITAAHCQTLCEAANALAGLCETLVAVWESRVRREIELGCDAAQAVELLDLHALYGAVGVEFEHFVFGAPTDPVQESILVLLRGAAAVRGALPHTPADVQGRAALVELLENAARILCDCRPSVEASGGTATGFLDEIRATEHLLSAVRPRARRVGRPRFVVEREVATALVKFLDRETKRQLLGHTAALLAVACPGLAGWREGALLAERRILLDDATLDAATRRELGRCRPDALPGPSRTRYIANLAARLRAWLGADLMQSLRRQPTRR